ncbi:hypothetical protein DNU06_17045 [Putridiphycobacter roseus]|uniref:Uncharacterized protein n=1 Tax=Putridiphycobacter roseus TaxID=2219161 RepID=A0A2W1NLN2_9FLAO|nr:hypothetical protein DNU06_17045 [Putridiphycobacter roseus]
MRNIYRNTTHKNYLFLKERAENFLKEELGQQTCNSGIRYKSRYTYLEIIDTIYSSISTDTAGKVALSNVKLYFCCTSHMNIAFNYQIEGNQILQLDLKFDQFGNLDTLKSKFLSSHVRIIKFIEKNDYTEDFSKLESIAINQGIKGKFNYSAIENKDGTIYWRILGNQINIENGRKYQSGILIKVNDQTKTELIKIYETEFGA